MGTAGQSITLANSIIGVGILAMPFCYQQCGIILATLILLLMGLVSRLCCYFLLKSALIARKRTFEYLAFHVFGPTGKLAVEMGIIGFLMGTCIAYFVVVGDLGPQIIAKMFNINQSDILRTCLMVAVSLACVLPLGLLRDVHSLSSVSAVTLGFYFCLVIKIAIEAMGRAAGAAGAGAGAPGLRLWRAAGVLQCAPVLCMALFCQTQLFEVFSSFPGLSLERMSATSARAIHLCSAVYCALGAAGYAAFADQPIPGNVLMSLSGSTDSDVIKLGFVLSLCFSFPLVIFPCRASLYSFLYRRSPHEQTAKASGIPERAFRRLTVGIVACALLVSLLLPTVELVLGLVGSTAGVLVCVVFPAACFVRLTYKDTSERVLAKMTVVLGLTILVLGTVANLQALDALAPRADAPGRPEPGSKEHIDRIVEDFFQAQKLAEHRDVLSKPVQAKDKASRGEIVRGANAVDTDSEIQPPNPVPPEASDDVNNNLKLNIEPKLKEEIVDTKLKENVEGKKLAVLENTDTKDKPSPEMSDTGNVQTILKQVEENPQEKEEKRQLMQHKQLIETIKQHDKEQKELIKEQKEILDELHKTKKELDQNNKETGEGNKVAVESIQKIANVAIQSLTASEAPLDEKNVKKADVLNEIADEAVQEIAKKALESIVAIQEVKEKARDDVEARNAIIGNAPVMEPKQENPKNMNKIPVEKFRSDLKKLANLATLAVKRNITTDNKQINQETSNLQGDIQSVKLAPANSNPVPSEQEVANQLVRNKVDPNNVKKNEISEHSAVEEPQSNKVSEDMQKKKDQPLQQNSIPRVPIPLAMRDMRNRNSDTEVNGESVQNRQKREVVDCTARALRPEDRRICDALVSGPALPAVPALPSKVDFNEVLAKNVDINMIHRSLKSVRKQ